MRHIDPRTVDLDPVEQIVRRWHAHLLDQGHGLAEAVDIIRDATDDGTWATMVDNRLAAYLIGGAAPQLHDKLAALRTSLARPDCHTATDGKLADAVGTQVTVQFNDPTSDRAPGIVGGTLRGWSPDGDILLSNVNGSGELARIPWHKITRIWH